MSGFRVAVVQMEVADGQPQTNLDTAWARIRDAMPADLVLLPELWTTGYAYPTWRATAQEATPDIVARLQKLSDVNSTAIGGSMISLNDDGDLVNRFWLHRPGLQPVFYDKAHLFRPLDEHEYLTAGSRLVKADLGDWTAGLSVCYDLRFPAMFERYAFGGADLILCVSEWPAVRSNLLRLFAQARAAENQCYLVLCNRAGIAADGLAFDGGSAVIAPDGSVLREAGDGPTTIHGVLDQRIVKGVRDRLPVFRERVPGIDSGPVGTI